MRKIVYFSDLSKVKKRVTRFGSEQRLLERWGDFKTTAHVLSFDKPFVLDQFLPKDHECIFLVQEGSGVVSSDRGDLGLMRDFAVKITPVSSAKGEVVVQPSSSRMEVFVVSAPRQRKMYPSGYPRVEACDVSKARIIPYEISSYAQEIFAPKFEKTMGLKTFQFPVREIPRHIHPLSDRIILVARKSEGGWTEVGGEIYPMIPGSMCAFGRRTVHTNGPAFGKNYVVFAFQLPHVFSGITEKNVKGAPRFVRYVGDVPPESVWANVADLEVLKDKLQGNFGE